MILPRLVFVLTNTCVPKHDALTMVRSALRGGVDAVLLRERAWDTGKLLAFAAELRALTAEYQATLWVHSDATIAKAVGADGVHVSFADVQELQPMRSWLANDAMTLSVSCYSMKELQQAHDEGADFAFLSPVFATGSHPGAPALGVASFLSLAQISPIPVIALGGIDRQTLGNLHAFAGPVAVVGALRDANDVQQVAMDLRAARI